MRQGIAEQLAMLRMTTASLNKGEGEADALRTTALALAENLKITLEALTEIDNAPNTRGYDMMRGGRPYSGVSHNTVDMAVTRVARVLRRLPKLAEKA